MMPTGGDYSTGFLARIPLPWISILVGLACGLLAWLILDPIQNRELGGLFNLEQERRMEIRAADTRRRFEQYLGNMEKGLSGLARNWRLVDYLNKPNLWRGQQQTLVYNGEIPDWLDRTDICLQTMEPSQLMILEMDGTMREVYYSQDQPFPADQAREYFTGNAGSVVTSLWQAPYFLTWTDIPQKRGDTRAFLMAVIPLSERLLAESQQLIDESGLIVGLFDGDQRKVLSSNNISKVGSSSRLDSWDEDYMVTSLSLAYYQVPDKNIQFFSMIPRHSLASRLDWTLTLLRKQRIFEAIFYVIVFTLTLFVISSRLSHILRRIALFGHTAFGFEQPMPESGNQLMLLEARLIELFKRVRNVKQETQQSSEFRRRETETLKNILLDSALDPIITVDEKGLIIEANRTAEETFGFISDQILGKPLDELIIHPRDRVLFRQLLTRCRQINGPSPLCRAQKLLGTDISGQDKPLECSVMSVYLQDRTLFTVYLHDITEREKTELKIKSLADFVRENPSPVLRVNNRGVITYANLASDPLLSYWVCERGQTLPLFWRNLTFKSLKDGVNREYEINLNDRIISLLMVPVKEMTYVNLYGRDITQVRLAEQQSRMHQSELVHVCRVSTMGEMATGLAHELNQPLSAIVNFASGCVRRLQSGLGDEAELVGALAQITLQAERAGEIIRHLRALVAKQPREHEVADLNSLVVEVASFVEYEANRHQVEVTIELQPGGLSIDVDVVQIEQVLLNLVRNAIEAMRQVAPEKRRLDLITRRLDANYVEVLVKDSGPGIPSDTLNQLFDAFFSTKESGMGMGLSISRKIVESHEGHLSVKSEIGQGAVFSMVLPIKPGLQPTGV